MKKTLALVLAFALVFSTMTMAFADDAAAISADAKICADLGMLVGDGSGVTTAYTATSPNRLQAAVMFLRLKGLEAEANAFTGTDTFADAKKVAWGQPVMAYLKAHPELGWIGDGTNFDPASAMTAQQYYKVMLEALGYKQNTATVVGDFTWENVMTFAASKGLTKNAAVTSFTVNDLAVATVEALKATVKDGNKTLVATLVEAGKVDKAKAIASGVMADTTTSTAALDSVVASANDKVEVTFDADVAKDFAENAANYKVVVKGSTTALEVKSAKAVNSTIVELTTAAQAGGTAYTMTVGAVSKNFAGLAKNTSAPELDKVTCIDTNTIEVVFKKAVDRTSAEDIANYTLSNGAAVTKAELWIDQDDSRKTVRLTTDGVANNKVYKLKIANVKSPDLAAIKTVEKSFTGITDTKAPTIVGGVVVMNNQRVLVNFDDKHGIDKASAENLANYSIDGVKINSVIAIDDDGDDYAYYDQVEINTDPMDANKKYTLTISNLSDGSSSKNVISKSLTKSFYGKAVDKTAPKAGNITTISDNMVEVIFTETNRLDYTTLTDVNNYTFTEGLTVLKAEVLRAAKPDKEVGKTVILTTSTMDKDTTYKISIENVADEFGNVMTKVSNRSIPRTQGNDIAPPAVTKVNWVDSTTVELTFSERLDIDSANDPANYVINKDLGTVVKAELTKGTTAAAAYTLVTLTTPEQANNTSYTITINGIKDRSGNVVSDYKAYFTSGMKSADTDRPEIDTISAINNREVRITFNEAVDATGAAFVSANGATVINGSVVGLATPGYTIDDNTTVVFKTDARFTNNNEYTISSLTGIVDLHGNAFKIDPSDLPTYYGNSTPGDKIEVNTKDQLDAKTLQFGFSDTILVNSSLPTTTDPKGVTVYQITGTYSGGSTTFYAYVDKEDDETTEALSTLTLKSSTVLPLNRKYTFNFSNDITSYTGVITNTSGVDSSTTVADESTDTDYTISLEDKDDPMIDYVESVNKAKIRVIFNEDIDENYVGTYIVKDANKTTVATLAGAAVALDGDDDYIVNLTIGSSVLTAGDVYTLIPKTAARDIAGNSVDGIKDLEFSFVASAVADTNYIKGVTITDGDTIKVKLTAKSVAGDLIKVYNTEDTSRVVDLVYGTPAMGNDSVTVDLKNALLDGQSYTVVMSGSINDEFTIDGTVTDGGISIDSNNVTFSGWNQTEYVVWVVYNGHHVTIAPASATSNFTIAAGDYTTLGINSGDNYTIQVYRVVTPTAGWGGSYNAVPESAVLYTKVFTR